MTGTQPQAEKIRKMFGAISGRYDLTNSVLSFGIHHAWRKKLVSWSGVRSGDDVLDCATGTGDLAFALEQAVGPTGHVTGTDFCEEMLVLANRKAERRRSLARFQVADAMRLPFPESSFDLTTISFGIRNVADPIAGLRDMGRVTRPGGAVMVLEFGQPTVPVWKDAFSFYSRTILPRVGGWIAGSRDAYSYLETSSARFPCREDFLALARQTGMFKSFEYRPLMGGVAYLYKFKRGPLT